jgi:hypothetical protein
MTTAVLTQYYCKFCETINKFGKGIINTFETIGYARAANELARQGYTKQAKNLMLEIGKREKN